MRNRPFSVLGLIVFSWVGACGGGGGDNQFGKGTRDKVTGAAVNVPTGATPPPAAAYRPGRAPSPQGNLPISTPSAAMAITGGSLIVTVSGGGNEFTTVYVEVEGSEDHWEISVPAGTTAADIILTLAQKLPPEIVLVFVISDGAGNVSSPSKVRTKIMTVGSGDLQVSVSWDVDNDLDLHVVDPNGFEIYYGDEESPEGGQLDLDSNVACDIDGIRNENITWPSGSAPRGTYIVRVDNYENCQNLAASYVVTVQIAGREPTTYRGSFAADDIGSGGGDGAGVLVTEFDY